MTSMKLQKLTYYAQAWHLVATASPLFHEEFEAFEHGPLVRPLWQANKGKRGLTAEDIPQGSSDELSVEGRELIDAVIAYYGRLSAAQLRARSHEESPWQMSSGVIDVKLMHSYYACQLAETDRHPALPSWALVVIEQKQYDDMVQTADVPDDVSSLLDRFTQARAQLA